MTTRALPRLPLCHRMRLTPPKSSRSCGARVDRPCATGILAQGYPLTRIGGWLGYDTTIRRLAAEGVAHGWSISSRRSAQSDEDLPRPHLAAGIGTELAGCDGREPVWESMKTIANMRRLVPRVHPCGRRADEPDISSPGGESPGGSRRSASRRARHCHNRVMFKQLLRRRRSISADRQFCRLGGFETRCSSSADGGEIRRAVSRMRRASVLCEYVQHISLFDSCGVSASLRTGCRIVIIYTHFIEPVVISNGRYMPPQRRRQQSRCMPFVSNGSSFRTRGVARVSGTPLFCPCRCPRRALRAAYARRNACTWSRFRRGRISSPRTRMIRLATRSSAVSLWPEHLSPEARAHQVRVPLSDFDAERLRIASALRVPLACVRVT